MIIILDEIGKMECFSDNFKKAATEALDSPNIVVGTITLRGDDLSPPSRTEKTLKFWKLIRTIGMSCRELF